MPEEQEQGGTGLEAGEAGEERKSEEAEGSGRWLSRG